MAAIDREEVSGDALERELALMWACWALFDEVRGRVSVELKRGPRGGGKNRDQIVRHTIGGERDWAKKLGLVTPLETALTDEGITAHRDAYVKAIQAFHARGEMARTWPLRFLIRHTAFHTMGHAWEMDDKDLSGDRLDR